MNSALSIVAGVLGGLILSLAVGLGARSVSARAPAEPPTPSVPRRPPSPVFSGDANAESRAARLAGLARSGEVDTWRAEVRHWGTVDPSAAWAHLMATVRADWLRDHPEEMLYLARTWAEQDPVGLKSSLLDLPSVLTREPPTVLARLLVTLARVDPASALEAAQHHSGAVRECVSSFLRAWSLESPESAGTWAARLPPGEARDRAVIAVAENWSRQDPTAGLAFAQRHLPPHPYRKVLGVTLQLVAQSDPSLVAPALAELPAGRFRAEWIHQVTGNWMRIDPTACAEWITSLPAGPDRERALYASAKHLAVRRPEQALELARTLDSTSRQKEIVSTALRAWAEHDRSAAIAYAQQLPDEGTRQDVLRLLSPPPSSPLSTEGAPVVPELTAPPLWQTPSLNLDAPSPSPPSHMLLVPPEPDFLR